MTALLEIPEEYVLLKFYEHAGYPQFKKGVNVHEAGCPICREGRNWGRKRRAYYIPGDGIICCHNCGWYGSTLKWILEVANMTRDEIVYELDTGDYKYVNITLHEKQTNPVRELNTETLPKDSINLTDPIQLSHFKNNNIINQILEFIHDRRLDTGINRPKALFTSLTDFTHKNRLCLPFYDSNDKIIHYQTRGVLAKDLEERPKYLSKCNSQKSLFNYNNVSPSADTIYIFEGPIDSCFVENSVAVAGIQESGNSILTSLQKQMLATKTLSDHTWVLDNQWIDTASYKKTKHLIDSGDSVFIWPREFRQFKDFNDICVKAGIDRISSTFLEEHTYKGLTAKLVFNQIVSA